LATPNAEDMALLHANVNQGRAACLKSAVDRKIAYDVKVGKINDFGNVITMPVCKEYVWTEFLKNNAEEIKKAQSKK